MNKLLHRQHGAATLLVAMILLFTTSVGVLYLNRGLLFEQKSSANQARSTAALEAAEAGLEWAIGMLNDATGVNANCATDTTQNSFRRRYVQTNFATTQDIAVAPNVQPGCYINNGALTCRCPNASAGAAALSPPSALPGFTVSFAAVAGTTDSVQITSVGCNAIATTSCNAATAANADATATVRATLKLRRLLLAAPASPLTCGHSCALGGSYNLVNTDVATNGITMNAGNNTSVAGGSTITSISGMPAENSRVGNDSTLGDLNAADPTCTEGKVFKAYFGSSLEDYVNSPMTKTISCNDFGSCNPLVQAAMNEGWRAFYFPDGFYLNSSYGGPLGSVADPVSIVTPGELKINGNIDVYGILYSNNSEYDNTGTGSSTIQGALISCNDFQSNGNGTIAYNPAVLSNLQSGTAIFVKVPGSWRDF